MIESIGLATAIASFFATGAAAYAAWRMPKSIAFLAETLRREWEQKTERHRNKLHVFAMLMQERATIYSETGVKALNLVDVVFNDVQTVRDAWAELFQAFEMKPVVQDHVVEERLRKLLAAMATDLNLTDRLRLDDFARVYHPNAIAQERIIKDVQRQNQWRALQESSPAANTSVPQSPFPPKP